MSKNWKIWIAIAGLLMITNIAMRQWYWPSKIDQAYEQGKIDGQIVVRLDFTDLYSTVKVLYPKSMFDTFYVMTALYDKDSLLVDVWGQRIIVDQPDSIDTIKETILMRNGETRSGGNLFFEFIDSTDTMPMRGVKDE